MKSVRYAFTMIELVFVIVVLGILAAVAIPKIGGHVSDAKNGTAKAVVASIRSAIASERQANMMKGSASYPDLLDDATKDTDHEELFDGNATIEILQYPIYSGSSSGDWRKTSDNSGATITYDYYIKPSTTVEFTYTKATGVFNCDHSNTNCRTLAE